MEEVKNTDFMGEEGITRLLYRFSLPATVGFLVMASYNVVDTIFVGKLGSEAIAALSMAFPLQMLLGAIGAGTGIGAASLISRSLGAGDKEEADRALGQVITLSIMFGLVAALAGLFFLRPLLIFLGSSEGILALTEEYLSVIVNGALMFFLIMTLSNAVRAEGNPVLSMNVMIISAVVNIVLDPIFIFLLNMGVRGAAVATVLSKVAGVAILLGYFLRGKSVLKFRTDSLKLRWQAIFNIYRVGLPAMILQFSVNISLVLANYVLTGFGHIPLAVMGLVYRLQMFTLLPALGISQGLLPIIGYNYGAKKFPRVREALLKGAGSVTVLVLIVMTAYLLKPVFFLSLFNAEAELLSTGSYALRIMMIMYPLTGIQIVSSHFFQAVGKGIPSLLLSLLREVMFFTPLVLIMPGFYGLNGVWFARPLSDLLAFLITIVLVARELNHQGIPLHLSLRPT